MGVEPLPNDKGTRNRLNTNRGFSPCNRTTRDLVTLSSLGHFLKGSSATLGFNKIRNSCEVIQQYGSKNRLDGSSEPDEAVCLKQIEEALKDAIAEKDVLEKMMKKFFNQE